MTFSLASTQDGGSDSSVSAIPVGTQRFPGWMRSCHVQAVLGQ